jgi:glycosyltransferase involved in cell wall biosynthesis
MSRNFEALVKSLLSQKDDRWRCIFVDDMSTDDTWECISVFNHKKFNAIKNNEKKFALKNIVENSRLFQNRDDVIIAVIDGDDMLCNENTVSLLIDEYDKGLDVVWTAHRWDINGMNISKEMPPAVDPYAWPWSSSHLRSFKATLLKQIPDNNFKNTTGEWFKRGYDQALMLPILSRTSSRSFLNTVCYQYNINSVSMTERSWEEHDQISTINIVRSRGFLSQ